MMGYKNSIFGILCAAKGNLPESKFNEIVKSVLTDLIQLDSFHLIVKATQQSETQPPHHVTKTL